MLLEVPFINGYNEFIEYYSKEVTIEVSSDVKEYKFELLEPEVLEDSISYINLLNLNLDFDISLAKFKDKSYIEIESYSSLKGLKILVSYTYKNMNPKHLYSVDYQKGIIYFSETNGRDFNITYDYDNIYCTGKKARQMAEEEYSIVNNIINIKNYKDNSTISFLHKNDISLHRNTSPIIQDLKINYIIKDDLSL